MKIRLLLNGENADEIRQRLEKAGFETGDDGEYVLTEVAHSPELLAVRDESGQRLSIAQSSIVFIESYGHDVIVHATDGSYFSFERLYRLS